VPFPKAIFLPNWLYNSDVAVYMPSFSFSKKTIAVILPELTGPSGLIMGLLANGGWLSMTSFTMLAILWWYFTYMAYVKVKQKVYTLHQKYMIRSYALTLSAITFRLW